MQYNAEHRPRSAVKRRFAQVTTLCSAFCAVYPYFVITKVWLQPHFKRSYRAVFCPAPSIIALQPRASVVEHPFAVDRIQQRLQCTVATFAVYTKVWLRPHFVTQLV